MSTIKRFELAIGRAQTVARGDAPVTLWVEKGTVDLVDGVGASATVVRRLAVGRQVKLPGAPVHVRNAGRSSAVVFVSAAPSLVMAAAVPADLAAADAELFVGVCRKCKRTLGEADEDIEVARQQCRDHVDESPGCKNFVEPVEVT